MMEAGRRFDKRRTGNNTVSPHLVVSDAATFDPEVAPPAVI
jgi:hypothetical protein